MKRNLFIFTLFILTTFIFANENISNTQISMEKIDFLFNKNISSDEKKQLQDGQLLIRNIGNAKKICLEETTLSSGNVIDTMKSLKPAYLAEVIQIRPVTDNENLLSDLEALLIDVQGYVGIPYYSVQNKTWYDLYSSAEVLTQEKTDTGYEINTNIEMNPFGIINMDMSVLRTPTQLLYKNTNTTPISYSGIKCVSKNKLISYVYVFIYEDWYILYGIGGVNAPSIFFLRDRIETSFINKITTFCEYMYKQL